MLPDTNTLSSELKDIFCRLDISHLNSQETLQLAEKCENSIAGLCHGLHFLGKTFITFAENDELEFSPESLCQLGHGLRATATVLPALYELQLTAERQLAATESMM
jgi:hypothetical protein